MYFYDILDMQLPEKAQYYFNVLVVCISIPIEEQADFFPDGTTEAWYLDRVTSSQPIAYHIFLEEELEDEEWLDLDFEEEEEEDIDIAECDYNIDFYPHSVLEVHPTLGVSFYDMLDFDTDDSWRIN